MQIGPRADVPEWNNKGRGSPPVHPYDATDPHACANSCFFRRATARGTSITHLLVEGGIGYARENGPLLVEACPIAQSKDPRSIGLFVGSARVFENSGFTTMVERKVGRPLMRLEL